VPEPGSKARKTGREYPHWHIPATRHHGHFPRLKTLRPWSSLLIPGGRILICGTGLVRSPGKGEILLVHPFSLVKIGVQVNFGGLDGGMTEVLLDDTEIF